MYISTGLCSYIIETELNSNESTSESDIGSETDDSNGAETGHNSRQKKDRNRDKESPKTS